MAMSGIKKMVPKKFKNGIKKMLGMRIEPRTTKTIFGAQLLDSAKKAEVKFKRKTEKKIVTKIKKATSFPVLTRSMDYVIDKKLKSKKYTFDDILVINNPYNLTPLCAYILFYTDKEVRARFIIDGDIEEDTVVGDITIKECFHRVPVFGLYPNRKNPVRLQLINDNGKVIKERKVTITTPDIKPEMQGIIKPEKHTKPSAYNLIQISGKFAIYPFAFDSSGVIRYYLDYRPRGYGFFPLANGHQIMIEKQALSPMYEMPHSNQVYEMDYLGRIHKQYFVERGCHHDVFEKVPNGNLLFVSNSLDGYQEDMIMELDRETGEVVKTLDMRKVFGEDYCENTINWVHVNTISYYPEDNSVFISPRNLHAGVKVDWETDEIKWIIGNPDFFKGTRFYDKVLKPVGDIEWFFQSHALYILPDDLDGNPDTKHIILFDNHWQVRRPVDYFDNDNHSFAKIYTINEKEKTVSLLHKYRGERSKITSNAQLDLKNRRVFSFNSFYDKDDENGMGAKVYEFDYDTEEVVNQWAVKCRYYRGYEFAPNYDSISRPIDTNKEYVCGNLQVPKKIERPDFLDTAIEVPKKGEGKKNRPKFKLAVVEDIMYIYGKDHSRKGIYFVGENDTFYYRWTKTKQHKKAYGEMIYAIPIDLNYLDIGKYEIYLNFEDTIYKINKNFEVR